MQLPLVKKFLPSVSLENRDLGSGPRFPVVDPGVHYQGILPSPILSVQALHLLISENSCGSYGEVSASNAGEKVHQRWDTLIHDTQ